jgi:hypothetical protein
MLLDIFMKVVSKQSTFTTLCILYLEGVIIDSINLNIIACPNIKPTDIFKFKNKYQIDLKQLLYF